MAAERGGGGDIVASPCILVCTLDSSDICLGCGRTLDEIGEWSGAEPARQREIVAAAERRRAGEAAG